ncbi:hypothetical protein BDZ89DRAFT_1142100 [Hymenopellis radicata]|nr:hypothetical protein BDZ89DRAFT_1142100 [Hymenopellis radicata]
MSTMTEGLAISGSGEVDGTVSKSTMNNRLLSLCPRLLQVFSHARSSLKSSRGAFYEAVSIAQHSHVAAARPRRAFGIPPSESDEVYRETQAVLLHADGVLSEMNWQDDEEREDFSECFAR